MTPKEVEAIETLKTGMSWQMAAQKTKLSEDRLKSLWGDYIKTETERAARLKKVG